MLIFDENSQPIILDSILTPTIAESLWVLDFQMEDYTLTPLAVLEETVSPSIELMIAGFRFVLPASWNILVCDEETMQLDVCEVAAVAGKEFKAFVYGPDFSMPQTSPISATDYHPNFINVGPQLSKHQMLCHPISPDAWVNVSPSDAYNKYLKGKVAGDII